MPLNRRRRPAVDHRTPPTPYSPLVTDWLAFLAERLTVEFLREHDTERTPA
jgi:hypothetical protein